MVEKIFSFLVLLSVVKLSFQRDAWRPKKALTDENYLLKAFPIEIKTTSKLGSNEMIQLELYSPVAVDNYVSEISILLSNPPKYSLADCKFATVIDVDLPKDDIKVWTISYTTMKNFYPRLEIRCNGVLAVDLQVSDTGCDDYNWPNKLASEVSRLRFGLKDSATQGYRRYYARCKNIKHLGGCVKPENDSFYPLPGTPIVIASDCIGASHSFCITHDKILVHFSSGLCVELSDDGDKSLVLKKSCTTKFPNLVRNYDASKECWKKSDKNNKIIATDTGCPASGLNGFLFSETMMTVLFNCGTTLVGDEKCHCLRDLRGEYSKYRRIYRRMMKRSSSIDKQAHAVCQNIGFECNKEQLVDTDDCRKSYYSRTNCTCAGNNCHKTTPSSRQKRKCNKAIYACEKARGCI